MLVGAGGVALALGVARLSHRVALLPLSDLRGKGVAKWRGMLWAAIFKPRGVWADPISQLTLQDLTGVQPRQQLRYRSGLVKVHRSSAVDEYRDHHGETRHAFSEERIPLAYTSKLEVDGYGMARKLNVLLREAGLTSGEARRRYFRSAMAILELSQKRRERLWMDPWGPDLRLLVPRGERLGRKRPQWAIIHLSEARSRQFVS